MAHLQPGQAVVLCLDHSVTSRRRVLVTGASRGFGAACVEVFAAAGWDVVAVARTPLTVNSPRVVQVLWDVTDDDVEPLHAALGDRPLDLLVNNAGTGTPGTPLEDVDVATLLAVCDVNVGGVLRATRAALPSLRRAPAPLVINISSRLGSVHDQADGRYAGFTTSYAYRISKAAQNMATVGLAQEFGPHVKVWAVHPGRLATGMGRAGAAGDPGAAAETLRDLVDAPENSSPRYINLDDGTDIHW